jgi:hypothetical protein
MSAFKREHGESAQKVSKITKRIQNWVLRTAETGVDPWHTIHHAKDHRTKTESKTL